MTFRLIRYLLSLAVVSCLLSCGTGPGTTVAGNPAAPPAPPAELPSALIFPRNVNVGVDAIDINNTAAPGSALTIGDNIKPDVGISSDSAILSQRTVDNILAPLQPLAIPTSPKITHFEDVIFVNTGSGLLGSNQTPMQIKIDFGDFDLDGDGIKEGCSGHTAALPICYRIWVGGKRKLAGVFETYPTQTSPGRGRFRGTSLDDSFNGFLAAIYDLEDSNKKSVESLIGFGFSDPGFAGTIHTSVDQDGPDLDAKKVVKMSGQKLPFDPGHPDVFQEVGQFFDRQNLISLSKQTGSASDSYSDACATLPDGIVVETSQCSDLGLDVSGIDFLSFVSPSDVLLSSDFPFSPTF